MTPQQHVAAAEAELKAILEARQKEVSASFIPRSTYPPRAVVLQRIINHGGIREREERYELGRGR